MKTVQIKINLYSLNELSSEAKQVAILNHGDFLNSFPHEYENENGEMVEEYIEHNEDEIIESILINNYYFFKNGELANVKTYTGKHPKAGVSEFGFMGNIYEI